MISEKSKVQIGLAGLVGGTAAWASGSDFNLGALAGGFGMAFNELGDGHEESVWRDDRSKYSPEENMYRFIHSLKTSYNRLADTLNNPNSDVILYGAHYGSLVLMVAFPEAIFPLLEVYSATGVAIGIKGQIPEIPRW